MRNRLGRYVLVFILAPLAIAGAQAADLEYRHHTWVHRHWHRHIVLPPERHVIEVVRGAHGPSFVINGANFTAKGAACRGWVAGDRIKLLAGSWHGACVDAAFYNLSRHRTCEMWCG
jgi:hypothetical protein